MSSAVTQHDPGAASEWIGRRADARRNHSEVFAAATEVLAERGLDATIPEIAARAGVGKATVYRSYPTKAALVEAVAREQLTWLRTRVHAAAQEADAFAALAGFLGDVFERLAEDRLFSHVLANAQQRRKEKDHVGELALILVAAQRKGDVRPDATTQDIHVLVGGVSRVLLDLEIHDPAEWRRYATLALNALRPDC